MKYLIVVDMQNDFVTGCLGTKEARGIVPYVLDYVKNFKGTVIFTKDTHHENYMETQEGKKLPVPHCIFNTEGWELIPELAKYQKEHNCLIFNKETFGSKDLAIYLRNQANKENIESITLIGVCTDICVISNGVTIKAFLPEVPINVLEKGTAAVTPENQIHALETMKSLQFNIQ